MHEFNDYFSEIYDGDDLHFMNPDEMYESDHGVFCDEYDRNTDSYEQLAIRHYA